MDEEKKKELDELERKKNELKEKVDYYTKKKELKKEIKQLEKEKSDNLPIVRMMNIIERIIRSSIKAGKKFVEEIRKE